MSFTHDNSMVQRGGNTPAIESGQIINVDMAHWTVDVRTIHSQRLMLDLQVGAPYLHFHSGEGIFAMPEVGAKVQVCLPSDDRPFILCFITTFERGATGDGTTQPDTGDGEEADITFRSGRPKLQQGDLMMRCRDGNQIWLHRGGVVEIEATAVAKRVYIPITNMIRDVCENYEMLGFGGEMLWTTTRDDTDPEGEARTVFTLAARDHAQEKKDTVMLTAGHVDDEGTRLRLMVAPNAIDPKTRTEDDDTAVFDFTVDEEGNVETTIELDATRHIKGKLSDTVDGEVTQEYGATTTTINGDQTVEVSGNHELSAAQSTERVSGLKTLDCTTKLGAGASTPFVLATADVIAFMAGHTHTTPAGPSGIPTPNVTSAWSSKSLGE